MEVWKEIKGYNNVYLVSNLGNVKSNDHFCKGKFGIVEKKGRILKLQKSKKGYLQVSLSFNGKRFHTGAHRLVALSFIENLENKLQVNHINGIKQDNRVENLEWCTNQENQMHAVKNNLSNPNYGEKHHMAKLTNKDVLNIRALHKIGFTNKEMALDYMISQTAMSKIINNKTYINI